MAEPTGFLAYIRAGRELRPSNAYAKCLLLYYCSNVDSKGTFFKSAFDIQYETGLSERFIHKTNAKWKEMGLLSIESGSNLRHKANTYTINLEKLRECVEKSKRDHDAEVAKEREQWAERSRRYRERQAASRCSVQ